MFALESEVVRLTVLLVCLQKYRLYLKRLSGVTNNQSGMNAHFGGQDPFSMMSPDIGVNIASGQLTPQALARFHMLGRMQSPNGMGFSGGLDPVLNNMFLQDLPQPPHLNGMLKPNTGLLSSLPNGLHNLDQLTEPHHIPGVNVNDLDDYPSNTKVFPQLNGNLDVSIASLGVPNPSNDNLLMHMYPRGASQGGGSSSSLPQPRLSTSHLLPNDINFAPVGPLPAVGLSAITGSAGARDLSPTTGTSLSSPLGTLVRRPLMNEEPNSTSGAFAVQSPKAGGDEQQPMWALYNPISQLNHNSHESVPWSGLAENLGLGDISGSQFSQDHGIGSFAPPSRGSYSRQNVSFPVSSALDGRMVRSSYEP